MSRESDTLDTYLAANPGTATGAGCVAALQAAGFKVVEADDPLLEDAALDGNT